MAITKFKDFQNKEPSSSGITKFKDFQSGSSSEDKQKAYVDGMKNSRLMEVETLKTKQAEEKATKDTMKALGIDLAGNVKRFGEFKSGIDAKQKVTDDKKAEDRQKLAESRADTRKYLPSGAKKILSGIDKFADFIKPGTDIAESLYTPAAGLTAVNGLTKGAAFGVSKLFPKLAGSLGGRATQTALTEGIVGAPLGLANTLAQNPEASNRELLINTGLGAGGGAVLGGAGRLIGEGVQAGLRKGTQALLAPTLDNSANMARAINDVSGENLPQTVRRTVSRGAVPEVFSERFRRVLGNQTAATAENIARTAETSQRTSTKYMVGDMAIPTSADGTEISKPSKILDVQSKDGVNYYRFEGSNTYMPENQVKISNEQAANATPPVRGERANYATQVREGNFGDEFNQGIANRDRTYPKDTNAAQIAEANERVKNLSKAESDFHINQSPDGNHVATGYRLLQELNRKGETLRALNVADKLAADLTKMGQGTQAARIIERLSPEGQLLHLQRTASKSGKTVTPEDGKLYAELAGGVQKGANSGQDTIDFIDTLDKIKAGQEVSPEEFAHAASILEDANKFIKPGKEPSSKLPKEVTDVRTRDKIATFFDDAEKAALARIKSRKNNLNSLPLNEWSDHAIVVASQIVKGTIKAETYVEDMVRLFGESVKPYAKEVFEKASKMLNSSSKNISEGKLNEAHEVLRRLSGRANEEKATVKSMSDVVKKVMADAKTGIIDPEDLATIRTLADEISAFPTSSRTPTAEQKFLQSVKALAKKLSETPSEKVPTTQDNREVSSLLRQVTKLVEPEGELSPKVTIDNQHLSDIAHDLLEMKRPNPKPRTIHEKVAEKFIKENEIREGDIEKLRDLAKQLNDLKGKSAQEADMQMQAILNKYQKANAWDMAQAIRYIAMLFNTATQTVNALSGPIMATTNYAADLLGGLIDVSISGLSRGSRQRTTQIYASNPLKFIARYVKNAGTGARAGWRGVSPSGITGTGDIRGLTFKSLYNPLGLLERSLGAVSKGADYATYKTVSTGELERQGKLAASRAGVKGPERKEFIEKFMLNPPDEALEIADRVGKNVTFQRMDRAGGKVANSINNSHPLLKIPANTIVPFVKTPLNIAEHAIDLTPVGAIRGIIKLSQKGASEADRRDAIQRLGLSLVGGGLSATGFYLNQIGVITGNNESGDIDVDKLKESVGQGKYRLNVDGLGRYARSMLGGKGFEAAEKAAKYQSGDSQIDYNKFQPLALPLAAGAAASEHRKDGVESQLQSVAVDAGSSLFSMSALRGIQDAFQAPAGVTGAEKATAPIKKVFESFIKSFSPGLLAQETNRRDDTVRKVSYNEGILQNVKEYFMSRTPGQSTKLPPKVDYFGSDVKKPSGFVGAYLNPYRSQVASNTPAARKLAEIYDATGDKSVAPGTLNNSFKGKDAKSGEVVNKNLDKDAYAKLQKKLGELQSTMINKIPDNLTPEQKAYLVDEIYEFTRKGATLAAKQQLGIKVED